LKLKAPVSGTEYRNASIHSKRRLKGVIIGPYTLTKMSVDEYYRDEERLVMTLASILREEILALQEAGAQYIQIDEPYLTWASEGLPLAMRVITEMLEGNRTKTILCLYFGSIKPLVPALYDLPVDIFAVDTVSKPENLDLLLKAPLNKGIIAGCFDARNIKPEQKAELFSIYKKLTSQNRPEIFVSPSCGLEFLPHSDATAKLKWMVKTVKEFNSGRLRPPKAEKKAPSVKARPKSIVAQRKMKVKPRPKPALKKKKTPAKAATKRKTGRSRRGKK
ncbi:MAG TPA: hypothetical protein VFR89_00775, partial [candidate division Zixibacteria bacterium]|nr:hypothetical protein [candidate division Zixibacteria bacterium]